MDSNLIKTANREFRIVFQPYFIGYYSKYKRFLISANRLAKYVGRKNAETALTRALNSKDDKCTVKFRTLGRIDFYLK